MRERLKAEWNEEVKGLARGVFARGRSGREEGRGGGGREMR